jgi:hypothetical protein
VHDFDRLVVGFAVDRVGRAVLPTVRKRKARRIALARVRAVISSEAVRMPVEAKDATEGLEPIRVRQAPQHILAAEVARDEDDDLAGQRNHPLEQIARRLAAMQREMRESGSGHRLSRQYIVRLRTFEHGRYAGGRRLQEGTCGCAKA